MNATLSPAGISSLDGWTYLKWELKWGNESFLLSHAVQDDDTSLLTDPRRGDHALVAVLLWAMKNKLDVAVEGKVSPRLLDGLETLQEIWHRWKPSRYSKVSIKAQEESAPECVEGDRPAIFAFSGGVDASFSVFRHLKQKAGRNNRKPGAALIVQGMDIPIDRDDFFQSAMERARLILAGTHIPLIGMKTNSRALSQDWVDSFGLQLIACYLVLQNHFAFAVHGSGEPYDTLVIPWGSTPLTDPLLSSESINIDTYGCEFDRTEKVKWLSENTAVCNHLRVCWAGPNLGQNCCECEKCIRTMLNFWATKHKIPNAFPKELTTERIKTLKPKNEIQLREIKSLYRHACINYPKENEQLSAILYVINRYASHKKLNTYISYLPWRLQVRIKRILGL